MNALVAQPLTNADLYRASTDAASLCREIVMQTAMEIQNRKYVKVEGWQAIAIAHGCTGSARDVEQVPGGVRAIGEIRRMSDGALIAQAEGFVGEDEPTWYGGIVEKDEWTGPKGNRRKTGKVIQTVLPKRADYAIRAMAQTRAISRACRSAFAHVVVLIDSNLSTTPAEEVPYGGFSDDFHSEPRNVTPQRDGQQQHDGQSARERFQAEAMRLMGSISDVSDEEGIRAWWPDNQRDIDMLPDDLFGQVKDHYEVHWAKIAKAAKAAKGSTVARQDTPAEEVFA
ncbi:hypothetical protein [Caulobacter sp. FWC2]|uniref:hypothetical protein n=1 Tax=Caulobacter sp. FWC2 TaxID=69664 RepID=UPI0018ED2CC6|nr:hypothetical protein [Caulobacter sp. FWC2]